MQPRYEDGVWISLLLKIFVEESIDIVSFWRQLGILHGTYEYLEPANAVDWFSLGFAALQITLWFQHLTNMGKIREHLGRLRNWKKRITGRSLQWRRPF